jgi:hypothetical protein
MQWLCRAGGRRSGAEKGGTWGIAKKEFFIAAKNTVFWQILKSVKKRRFRSMKTGVW